MKFFWTEKEIGAPSYMKRYADKVIHFTGHLLITLTSIVVFRNLAYPAGISETINWCWEWIWDCNLNKPVLTKFYYVGWLREFFEIPENVTNTGASWTDIVAGNLGMMVGLVFGYLLGVSCI